MSVARPRAALRVFTAVAVLAAAASGGWWLGRGDAAPQAASTAAEPAADSAAQAQMAGTPEPFALAGCSARLFENAPALAISFTQPLKPGQDLSRLIRVLDMGPVPTRGERRTGRRDGDDEADDETTQPPGSSSAGAARQATGEPVDGAWVLGDNPRVAYFPYVKPLRQYAVSADAALRAHDESQLPEPTQCDVDSQAMAPAFYFASRGVVLPPGQNGGLPVVTVNTPEVDVEFLRIAPENLPAFYADILGVRRAPADTDGEPADEHDGGDVTRTLQGSVGLWDLDRLEKLTHSVFRGRFLAGAAPDRRHVTFLPVEEIEALAQPGMYVAVMSEPGRFRYEYQVTYFYVSDIGVHMRRHADQLNAFATSLASAQPMADVTFELLGETGRSLATAKADAQGHARFDGRLQNARLLLARRGNEQTVIALQQPALDLSEFNAGGHPSRSHRVFAYAGRDLYRPGETFTLSVLRRDATGRTPQGAAPLTATLKRPDGRIVRTEQWQFQSDVPGYVQRQVSLPVDAPTGTWMLELRVDPAAPAADTSWRFQVEEFLPERMKLQLTPSAPLLFAGQSLSIRAQGDYLYGSPAAGNRLLGSLQVERLATALPEQWPGFLFGDVADDDRRQWQELPEQELDAEGVADVDIPLDLGSARSPMRIRTTLSLLESGGRPVVRSSASVLWPAEALIGVRPLFSGNVAQEGSLARFDVVRVNADGTLAPLQDAALQLFREEREYYWRFDDQGGWNSGYIETEELVESQRLDLSQRATLALPVQWGRYRLEIHDPEMNQTLRYRFYAGWGAQDAEAMGNRPDRVQLKISPEAAQGGDTLVVNVLPPHNGQAIVMLESDRLLWQDRVAVGTAGADVRIPLDPRWQRQDLYVSAVVFRPGEQGGSRVTPARAVGLAHVAFDNAQRKLELSLQSPPRTLPEAPVTLRLKLNDPPADAPAWVTVSAVDVGILNVTRYATPDPFDFFFGQQRYGAEMLDMYGRLIEKIQGVQGRLKWGGDSMRREAGTMPPRVQLTDLFSGPVRFDADGAATVTLDLPDFNGTVRLMATAFTDSAFGNAQQEMVIAAPIVAELSMPRFVTPGDTSILALDLTNLSGQPQELNVLVRAHDPLMIGEPQRTLRLTTGERRTLHFTAQAGDIAEDALIELEVDGAQAPEPIRIRRAFTLAVQPTGAPIRHVQRQRLAPGAALPAQAFLPDGGFKGPATLSIAASGSAPFDIGQLARDLLDYPYGCTEQTASAAYPYLILDAGMLNAAGLGEIAPDVRNARIESAIARLAGVQRASGGFPLWADGAQDVWLTAYVTGFLQQAQDAGHAIPGDMIGRAEQWLLERLREAPQRFARLPAKSSLHQRGEAYSDADYALARDAHARFAGLAFAGYILATRQKAPLASLRQLQEYADNARSPLPLVHLAASLQLMGDTARADTALQAAMSRRYGIDASRATWGEWLGDYGTVVRDNAMAYAVMHRHGLTHARHELLLADVAAGLNTRRWLSTQEQLALLMAASAAGGDADADWALRVDVAGGSRQLAPQAEHSISLDAHASPTLVNTSTVPVFVEITTQGHPRDPAAHGVSSALRIARQWYTSQGEPWRGGELRTGDTLIVGLTASADQRIDNALIVDRVPAGFEVENLNLSQGAQREDWELGGVRVEQTMSDPRVAHREYRDDRYVAAARIDSPLTVFYRVRVVNPGRYAVPAPVVEDMYRPEIRAVGSAPQTVTITDPRAR